jgi:hypothetical protein
VVLSAGPGRYWTVLTRRGTSLQGHCGALVSTAGSTLCKAIVARLTRILTERLDQHGFTALAAASALAALLGLSLEADATLLHRTLV